MMTQHFARSPTFKLIASGSIRVKSGSGPSRHAGHKNNRTSLLREVGSIIKKSFRLDIGKWINVSNKINIVRNIKIFRKIKLVLVIGYGCHNLTSL
jgi:hypothetical protein